MGMHLNYELRLPAHATRDVAMRALSALRHFARTLSFDTVSALSTDDAATPSPRETLQFFARAIAKPYEDDVPPLTGDPESAIGFFVNPGEGCETATFGLLKRSDPSGTAVEWFWHCSCKTQYATVVSDAHFVTCHTALTALLDHAIQLGFDVVVHDEGHYWETRDVARLLTEVGYMNRLVARFAGAFNDAVSAPNGPDVNIEAPIFEHPRFERLEMGERVEIQDEQPPREG